MTWNIHQSHSGFLQVNKPAQSQIERSCGKIICLGSWEAPCPMQCHCFWIHLWSNARAALSVSKKTLSASWISSYLVERVPIFIWIKSASLQMTVYPLCKFRLKFLAFRCPRPLLHHLFSLMDQKKSTVPCYETHVHTHTREVYMNSSALLHKEAFLSMQ